MLVLSRKESESILIGDSVRVTVITAADGRVRLGIDAPRQVHVLRAELDQDAYPRSGFQNSSSRLACANLQGSPPVSAR